MAPKSLPIGPPDEGAAAGGGGAAALAAASVGCRGGNGRPARIASSSELRSWSRKSWKMKAHGGLSAPTADERGLMRPISSWLARRTRLPFPTFCAPT